MKKMAAILVMAVVTLSVTAPPAVAQEDLPPPPGVEEGLPSSAPGAESPEGEGSDNLASWVSWWVGLLVEEPG